MHVKWLAVSNDPKHLIRYVHINKQLDQRSHYEPSMYTCDGVMQLYMGQHNFGCSLGNFSLSLMTPNYKLCVHEMSKAFTPTSISC